MDHGYWGNCGGQTKEREREREIERERERELFVQV